MPTIDLIDGICINIYYNDHVPAHIHAAYNEDEALVEIIRKKVYAGYLPGKQLKKVVAWLKENESEALAIFYKLNPRLKK